MKDWNWKKIIIGVAAPSFFIGVTYINSSFDLWDNIKKYFYQKDVPEQIASVNNGVATTTSVGNISVWDLPLEFRGMSDLNRDVLAKPYLNKSVENDGYISNKEELFDNIRITFERFDTPSVDNFVVCDFDIGYKEYFLAARERQKVIFRGEINDVGKGYVLLKKCQVVI